MREEFVNIWEKRVPRDVKLHLCQCWVILDQDKLAGYITLLADRLTSEAKTEKGKPILKRDRVGYPSFPAIKIGFLAADGEAKKAGTRLLEWALFHIAKDVAPRVGVRFVTVDALLDVDEDYDISGYYRKHGFQFVDPYEQPPADQPFRTLYYDLRDLIRDVQAYELKRQKAGMGE